MRRCSVASSRTGHNRRFIRGAYPAGMDATAYIVGPQDGPGAGIRDLALELGFEAVLAYQGLAQAEQQAQKTPVCFFLFAAVDDLTTLAPVAEEIRFCPHRRVRVSPLIYFAESPSAQSIRACVHMGFDDIITLPFTRDRLTERLLRQLDTNLTYFETGGYFGPERRGRLPADAMTAASRRGGHYRRIEIVRSLTNGVTVIRDEAHAA